jgi:hypothetical protein
MRIICVPLLIIASIAQSCDNDSNGMPNIILIMSDNRQIEGISPKHIHLLSMRFGETRLERGRQNLIINASKITGSYAAEVRSLDIIRKN